MGNGLSPRLHSAISLRLLLFTKQTSQFLLQVLSCCIQPVLFTARFQPLLVLSSNDFLIPPTLSFHLVNDVLGFLGNAFLVLGVTGLKPGSIQIFRRNLKP
jgi:hypothetical protein